jgi:CRP-like cAMP-binding protein/DNA repair exonuclease SbcCD ATPase subunit
MTQANSKRPEKAGPIGHLRRLVPLNSLSDSDYEDLVADVSIESIDKGQPLFRQGDTRHEHVYLLEGRIRLLAGSEEDEIIDAGTGTAKFPLAHQLPRKQTAEAIGTAKIARVDSRRLSDLLARAETVTYQVKDLNSASDDDWMTMLLQSRVLQQVPPANIQRVMMRVERVCMVAGDRLIRQGDSGDYYYVLMRGRAVVQRNNGDGKGPIELARLGPGDAFGEEALLSDSPRNSSVTMLEDGEVLRLSKADFLDLIQNPLIDRLTREDADRRVAEGAVWLDLRTSDAFDQAHFQGALNLPFDSLRYQADSLDPDARYVIYAGAEHSAMAGAFLLAERGFDIAVLQGEGGGDDGPGGQPTGPAVVPDMHADVPDAEDDGLQARVAEAETRARELETKLQEAERLKREGEQARQQQLEQVNQVVGQARRKLEQSEAQKQDAIAAQEQAYVDMARLTGNLEALQTERLSLQDRMAEIEGLDKQIQARLLKAERELIRERERAESATSSLDELSQQLADVLEQREQERDLHAHERGELIEEVTGLRMDLEQAQVDMQQLRTRGDIPGDPANAAVALRAQLEEMESANRRLQHERDALVAERDRLASDAANTSPDAPVDNWPLQAEIDAIRGREAEITGLLQRATVERDDLAERYGEVREALLQHQAESEVTRQRHEEEQKEWEMRYDALAERERELVARLDTSRADQPEGVAPSPSTDEDLAAELALLRSANEHLESQVAALQLARTTGAGTATAVTDPRDDDDADQAATIAALKNELEKLRAEVMTKTAEQAPLYGVSDHADADGDVESLRKQLALREQDLAAARDEQAELISALNAAGMEVEGLQQRLEEQARDHARLAELEQAFTELRRTHDKVLLGHQQEQRRLREKLSAEARRSDDLRMRLDGEAGNEFARAEEERESLEAELRARDRQLAELRETLAESRQAAEAAAGSDTARQVQALQAELGAARTQAARELAELRDRLQRAEQQSRRHSEADEHEVVSQEVMRQQIESLEVSLSERQREVNDAQASQSMLEDELEDAHRQVDEIRRELQKAKLDAEKAAGVRAEAESARQQLEQALLAMQREGIKVEGANLRDARLADAVAARARGGARRTWMAGLLGAGVALVVVAAAGLAGGGEFVVRLLQGGGG